MKKLFCAFLIIFCFTGFVFAQKESIPKIKKLVIPNYPVAAFPVSAEETFLAQIEINNEGKVVSVKSNAKRRFFHTVIEESLSNWIFDKSRKKSRKFEVQCVFKLFPFKSTDNISSRFTFPNILEINARKIKITDSPDY